MKHVLENHGDDFITEKELEVVVQRDKIFLSSRDFVNFDDVILQSDKVINVDILLSIEELDDLIKSLEIARDRAYNNHINQKFKLDPNE